MGLIFGTLIIGPRGAGGRILDLLRARRINRSLERYAQLVDSGKRTEEAEQEAEPNSNGIVDLTVGTNGEMAVMAAVSEDPEGRR